MTASLRLVWALYGVVAAAMLVTYSRVSTAELYHVGDGGLTGGLGRVLVFSNFSTALVAPIALALGADRLGRRGTDLATLAALCLCAVVAWPGVVDQADLDAKWSNAIPALGVLLALAFSVRPGRDRHPLGRSRLAAVAILAVLGLPWLAAEAGLHFGAGVFLTDKVYEGHAAVHLGHHHGTDGILLATSALLLWRAPDAIRRPRLALALRVYLSLLLAYGLVNAANDFWLEQVVKRGWASWQVPDALHPSLEPVWLVIVAFAAAALAADSLARRSRAPSPEATPLVAP
jgi:hypothetical protein